MSHVNKTLAQQASLKSAEYVMAKNKAAWLALFADDAIVADPVGISPLDISGKGHQGTEAIAAFWELAIAIGEIDFNITASHPCGYECANIVKLSKTLSAECIIETDLVAVYTVNLEGKITSLKAYWEFDKVQAQLDKAFA